MEYFSPKGEGNSAICNNAEEPLGTCAKGKKPVTERQNVVYFSLEEVSTNSQKHRTERWLPVSAEMGRCFSVSIGLLLGKGNEFQRPAVLHGTYS